MSEDKFDRWMESIDRVFGRGRSRRAPAPAQDAGHPFDPTTSHAPGQIAAIETIYGGYKFRSRLEARWALFFDTLDVKWQYEAQGYDLEGTWYLPDFWLPDFKAWVEVKNPATLMHDDNWHKSYLLHNTTGADVWVVGDLAPDGERLHTCGEHHGPVGGEWGFGYFFAECEKCGALAIECPDKHGHCGRKWGVHSDRITAAYEAARFARF